jgi:hypothetical protein
MNGKVFAIIARKGAGKSEFIKNKILRPWGFRKSYIYDRNFEYGKEFKNSFTELNTKENFLNVVSREASHTGANCNIIFEEATSYIRMAGQQDSRLVEQLTLTHHTGNIVAFVFHSMLVIPKDLRPNIDFWVIFQTMDDVEEVKRFYKGRKDILDAYLDVHKKTKGTAFDRDKKIYADERSEKYWHYNRIIAP